MVAEQPHRKMAPSRPLPRLGTFHSLFSLSDILSPSPSSPTKKEKAAPAAPSSPSKTASGSRPKAQYTIPSLPSSPVKGGYPPRTDRYHPRGGRNCSPIHTSHSSSSSTSAVPRGPRPAPPTPPVFRAFVSPPDSPLKATSRDSSSSPRRRLQKSRNLNPSPSYPNLRTVTVGPSPRSMVIGSPIPNSELPLKLQFPLFPERYTGNNNNHHNHPPHSSPLHRSRTKSPPCAKSIRRKPVPEYRAEPARPAVTIDAYGDAHIVNQIFDLSVEHSFDTWRHCSKDFAARVNMLFGHATVCATGSDGLFVAKFKKHPAFQLPFPPTTETAQPVLKMGQKQQPAGRRLVKEFEPYVAGSPYAVDSASPGGTVYGHTRVLDFADPIGLCWFPATLRPPNRNVQVIRVLSHSRSPASKNGDCDWQRKDKANHRYRLDTLVVFRTRELPFFPGQWDDCPLAFRKVVIHVTGCTLPDMPRILGDANRIVLLFSPQGGAPDRGNRHAWPKFLHAIVNTIAGALECAPGGRHGSSDSGPIIDIVAFETVEPYWTHLALKATQREGGPGFYRAVERVLWQNALRGMEVANTAQLERNTAHVNMVMKRLRFFTLNEYKSGISAQQGALEFVE